MAKFEGKSCDNCGNVDAADKMTTKTTRWTGPDIDQEVEHDLCEECVNGDEDLEAAKEAGTLRPVRRRKRSDDSAEADDAVQPDDKGTVRQ